MKPNPGGQIDPRDVIGRDVLIDRIWSRLDVQSLSLPAERRVGKTSVLRKMAAEPRAGWFPLFQDLEGISSVNDVAIAVHGRVVEQLGVWQKLANRSLGLLKRLGGTEIGGLVTLPAVESKTWKALLEHVIDDLLEHQKPNRVVFFWDEFPWMLEKIRDNDGASTARDVLDLLRSLRQTRADFRVIYTGSIGLHHVLGDLKHGGYGNEPVNDMGPAIDVPPLEARHAEELAGQLLDGARLTPADRAATVAALARESGGVPYYIHALVDELTQAGPGFDVAAIARRMLTKAEDPWDMRHYLTRISRYYPKDKDLVLIVLDGLAARDEPAKTDEILENVAQSIAPPKVDHMRELLRLLTLDHYLEKTEDRRYRFRFPLLKRWWGLEREIAVIE